MVKTKSTKKHPKKVTRMDELTKYKQIAESLQKELKETQAELRRRERVAATGVLASGVAHEIRNPLNIIGMTVEYLQSQLKPHDSKRELTEAIIEKVERLDRVTRELSSFGRARQLNIKKENLRKSLNLNLSLIKFKCRARGVKLKKEYSNLPLVEIDSAQMDKVFLNIMDNAIEAMPAGGVLTVSTEVNNQNQMVIIKIHNTGTPISKKHLAHIFEPFYTVKKKGTGLGLAIAHKVMLEHKGQLKVKNEYGRKNRGVTFIIQFPIHPPQRNRGI